MRHNGNGRFHPPDPGAAPLDPWKDFPMEDVRTDFAGRKHRFKITLGEVSLGYLVDAAEIGRRTGGYAFTAFDPTSPYLALAKLRSKMDRGLATCYLRGRKGDVWPTHDTLRGRIVYDRDEDVHQIGLSIDGRPISLSELSRIIAAHEGWDFELRFVDHDE